MTKVTQKQQEQAVQVLISYGNSKGWTPVKFNRNTLFGVLLHSVTNAQGQSLMDKYGKSVAVSIAGTVLDKLGFGDTVEF